MAKISTYPVVSPEGSDIIIGTDGSNMNATKNFTAQSIANLSPDQDLQSVLDTGNTATQSINLTGSINVTGNVSVSGEFRDSSNSAGTSGQLLMSTESGTQWTAHITPNLQNVLDLGNTATQNIVLTGNITADTFTVNTSISNSGEYYDGTSSVGTGGQILSSTGSATQWIDNVTPNLQNVLDSGNTATQDITLTGIVTADRVNADTVSVAVDLNSNGAANINGTLVDGTSSAGTAGQLLESTATGVNWVDVSSVLPVAGWNRFDDNSFTSSSKKTLLDGVTETMPNNGSTTVSYGPYTFYNPTTEKVLAENENDTYTITIVFNAEAPNANQTHLDLTMISGGSTPYNRLSESLVFAKGNSVTQNFHVMYQYYADDDFVTNGVQFEITANGGDAYIWDVIYFIQRNQVAV